jgi:hypothetical protein
MSTPDSITGCPASIIKAIADSQSLTTEEKRGGSALGGAEVKLATLI